MTTRFKHCIEEDLQSLRHISVQTFVDTYAHKNKKGNVLRHINIAFSLDQLLSELRSPNMHFVFLYEGNNLAGYFKLNSGKAQTEDFGDEDIELERIYLLTPYKGKGYGRLLINKAIKEGKKLKCKRMWLGVWKRNPEAVAFYKKMGFKIFGQHKFTVGGEEQMDWMMDIHL